MNTRINHDAHFPLSMTRRACGEPCCESGESAGSCDHAGERIVAGLALAHTSYVAFTASTEWRGFAEV